MDKKHIFIIPLVFLLILGFPMTAHAHGVNIEYSIDMTVEIVAMYDSGEPMTGAQVAVYAPDDLSNPWLTGVCDDEGRFTFIPDTSKPGIWDIQIRKAGHGDIVHISIGGDTMAADGSGYTMLQIALMSLCVIWGFVGMALYFSRRRS